MSEMDLWTVAWVRFSTLPIEISLIFPGTLTLDTENFGCSSLNTIHLNGKPMEDILTLGTSQSFDVVEVKVKELIWQNPIRVGGVVNGFNLPLTRENTLMVSFFLNLYTSYIFF